MSAFAAADCRDAELRWTRSRGGTTRRDMKSFLSSPAVVASVASGAFALASFIACSSSVSVVPINDDSVSDASADAQIDGPGTDGSATDGQGSSGFPVRFAAKVGADDFACNRTFRVGTSNTEVAPLDFRLYVSNVRLVQADGTEVKTSFVPDGRFQSGTVALLDFEDRTGSCNNGTVETNNTLILRDDPARATAILFDIGVPFEENHADAAKAATPLNLSTLFWNWNGGYKFMRIDMRYAATADPAARPVPGGADAGGGGDAGDGDAAATSNQAAYLLHLGSTGCVAAANGTVTGCARPNRPAIRVPVRDFVTAPIVLDYAELVKSNDLLAEPAESAGCMSGATDPACAGVFKSLGLNIASGTPSGVASFAK
jgi:uncharacterized repeat protein (TIGR04052 family)